MTLHQLHAIKQWQVAHRRDHPVEYHAWDTVLTAWVLGWMGEPAAVILWKPDVMLLCVLLWLAPTLYVRLRVHLHRAGRLRCDWIDASD